MSPDVQTLDDGLTDLHRLHSNGELLDMDESALDTLFDAFRAEWARQIKALRLVHGMSKVRDFTVYAMQTPAPLALRAEWFGISRPTANKWLRFAAQHGWIAEFDSADRAGRNTLHTVRARRKFWTDNSWLRFDPASTRPTWVPNDPSAPHGLPGGSWDYTGCEPVRF